MTESARPVNGPRASRWTGWVRRHSGRRWSVPCAAGITTLDAVLPLVPTQSLLIALACLHPRRWLRTGLWFALGGVLGGIVLAGAVGVLGVDHFAAARAGDGAGSDGWHAVATTWIRAWGPWALALLALLPLPVRTAIIVCAVGGVPLPAIALALAAGRVVAFPGLAWLVTRRPAWLARLTRRARSGAARLARAPEVGLVWSARFARVVSGAWRFRNRAPSGTSTGPRS